MPFRLSHKLTSTLLVAISLAISSPLRSSPDTTQSAPTPETTTANAVDKGLQAMENQLYGEAVTLFEEAVQQDPGNKEIWLHLIESNRQRDDRKGFLKATDQFLLQFPDDDDVRIICGRAWIQLRDWERLQPLRDGYAKRDDLPATIPQTPAEIDAQPFQTLILLDSAVRKAPEDTRLLLQLGNLLCRYGNVPEGLLYFERHEKLDPDNLQVAVLTARALRAIEDPERGIPAVEKVEKLLETATLPANAKEHLQQEVQKLLVFFFDLQSETTDK